MLEKSLQDYVKIISKHGSDARATMVVAITKCPLCRKWMIPPHRDSVDGIFSYSITEDFKSQVEFAGWVLESKVKVDDQVICLECAGAGKADFLCELCHKRYSTDKIKDYFGDPPEFLCVGCYETVPAKIWEDKVSELNQTHRWDFE